MIEHAYVDLRDTSSRHVHFTRQDDPLCSGVLRLAPGESAALATGGRTDLLVLEGAATIGPEDRPLERGTFATRIGSSSLIAGDAGVQVFVYRDSSGTASAEATVLPDDRPWREGRTPGMLIANLSNEGHALNLILWQPGAQVRHHAHPGGEEIFVLRGELCEEARYPAGSWIRLHPGAWHAPRVETPTVILVRSGHLKNRPRTT